jgi:hypothetical protein
MIRHMLFRKVVYNIKEGKYIFPKELVIKWFNDNVKE